MSDGTSVALTPRQSLALLSALLLAAVAVSCSAGGTEGWSGSDLVQPKELAAVLTRRGGTKPALLHVGPNVLYRNHRIPNSTYAGPAAKPDGLALLKSAVAGLPKDREIVIYCGCCPWSHCPNMRPAIDLLNGLGYSHVKALLIETNLSHDWIQPGYPTESGREGAQ